MKGCEGSDSSDSNDARLCMVHRSMFADLFVEIENGRVIISPYCKQIIHHERFRHASVVDGMNDRQRRHRRRRTLFGLENALTAVLNDPRYETLVFAISNKGLFTTGGSRSLLQLYNRLHKQIYHAKWFKKCSVEHDQRALTFQHTVQGASTFPRRQDEMTEHYCFTSHFGNEIVSLDAYEGIVNKQMSEIVALDSGDGWTRNNDPSYASLDRSTDNDFELQTIMRTDAATRTRRLTACLNHRHGETADDDDLFGPFWTCDVLLTVGTTTMDRPLGVQGIQPIKLLDFRFESATNAWTLISRVVDWCLTIKRNLGLYPVRRSVWDMLLYRVSNEERDSAHWRAIGANGLVDLDDISAFVHTMRVFVLLIFLGCCYGGIPRTASVNDRVSNRMHLCVFPPRTSGVYRALFHTSVLPHRLICSQTGSRRLADFDARHVGKNATINESNYDNPHEWLQDFFILCEKACCRFNIVTNITQ